MNKVEYTIHSDGTEVWRLNFKRHREDGPARIFPNGEKEWWLHGKFHREDGPAVIYPNRKKVIWFLNGIQFSFEDWCNEVKIPYERRIELKLRYG